MIRAVRRLSAVLLTLWIGLCAALAMAMLAGHETLERFERELPGQKALGLAEVSAYNAALNSGSRPVCGLGKQAPGRYLVFDRAARERTARCLQRHGYLSL